jgi:hypothetical protein
MRFSAKLVEELLAKRGVQMITYLPPPRVDNDNHLASFFAKK